MSRIKRAPDAVLIVEPSAYYTSLLRDWLAELGFRDVYTCTTAEVARVHINEQRFAALVIDSKLEDGSGIVLARQTRHTANSPNRMTPVIVLDGRATRRRVSAARDGGASEYVCKPMSRKSFCEHFRIAINDGRSFIKSGAFFGPDRRRHLAGWDGKDRRRQTPRRVSIEDGLAEA